MSLSPCCCFQTIKFSPLENDFWHSCTKVTYCLGILWNMFCSQLFRLRLDYGCCILAVEVEQCIAGNYRARMFWMLYCLCNHCAFSDEDIFAMSCYMYILSKPNRRGCSNVSLKNDVLLRSRNTVSECTCDPLIQTVAVLWITRRVLIQLFFERTKQTFYLVK